MNKRTVTILLTLGLLAAAGLWLSPAVFDDKTDRNQPQKPKDIPFVRVVPASKSPIAQGLDLTGSVEPYRVAELASPAEGPVESIHVREADIVDAGDVLLTIGRKKGIDASIVSLREELKKEEDNLRRTRQLVENDALPGEQLDQARAAFERVRALLINAEQTARDYAIKAPWRGVVSHVRVKEGQFLAPRAVLLEMYDPDSLVIRAEIPEKYAAQTCCGLRVDVRLDAYPDQPLQGHIGRVYPYLDDRLRTRTVEIAVDESLHLFPGMFARLTLWLQDIADAITVPEEAVVKTARGPVVFVVENGKAQSRQVETGLQADRRVQIVSGIQAGDTVIIAGNERLKSGVEVRFAADEN